MSGYKSGLKGNRVVDAVKNVESIFAPDPTMTGQRIINAVKYTETNKGYTEIQAREVDIKIKSIVYRNSVSDYGLKFKLDTDELINLLLDSNISTILRSYRIKIINGFSFLDIESAGYNTEVYTRDIYLDFYYLNVSSESLTGTIVVPGVFSGTFSGREVYVEKLLCKRVVSPFKQINFRDSGNTLYIETVVSSDLSALQLYQRSYSGDYTKLYGKGGTSSNFIIPIYDRASATRIDYTSSANLFIDILDSKPWLIMDISAESGSDKLSCRLSMDLQNLMTTNSTSMEFPAYQMPQVHMIENISVKFRETPNTELLLFDQKSFIGE